MSIIKTKVNFNSLDKTIRIPLNSNDDFFGYQQEIDNLTQITGVDLVTPVSDGEVRKFEPEINSQLFFYFLNDSGVYSADFFQAGYTADDIFSNSLSFLNSFFIMDFYDTYNLKTQQKIFTTYLTKLTYAPTYFLYTKIIPNNQQLASQFNYLYIPESFLQKQTTTEIVGYAKFSFYKAKKEEIRTDRSKIKPFINGNNMALTTPQKIFFEINLNLVTKKWKFITSTPSSVRMYEMNNANTYKEKIDNTFDNFENIKQIFPRGNTPNEIGNVFNDDGTYSTE